MRGSIQTESVLFKMQIRYPIASGIPRRMDRFRLPFISILSKHREHDHGLSPKV